MNCTNCNSKIQNYEKYCSKCGAKINTYKNEFYSRAALKENAKHKNKKPLIITTLIFAVIAYIISTIIYLLGKINITLSTTIIIFILLLIGCSLLAAIYIFDMYGGAIKISQDKKLSFKQVLTKFTKRPKNSISLILVILIAFFIIFSISILILAEDILDIFMPAFTVIIIVIAIYILPIFEMLLFTLADEKYKNKKLLTCLKQAFELPKGRRLEYYGLELSFIGWHVLAILTFGILYIWLYPYIVLSEANLYRKWKGETDFLSNKPELSNPIVILISVFIIILTAIITYIFLPEYESMSSDEYATIELDNKKITFKVPDNCKLIMKNDTDQYTEYNCNDNNDFISYALTYHFKDDFKEAKRSKKKAYERKVYNVKSHDYVTKINGKTTKVFYIDYKTEQGAEETFRDTYVFYRLSKYIDAEIIISINDVNKNNLEDYIKIKQEESL